MKKGTLFYITLALLILPHSFKYSSAQDALDRHAGTLIRLAWPTPAEVICGPVQGDSAEPETIVLEPGQQPENVCPRARIRGLVYYPETINGEPPPEQVEAPPSDQ